MSPILKQLLCAWISSQDVRSAAPAGGYPSMTFVMPPCSSLRLFPQHDAPERQLRPDRRPSRAFWILAEENRLERCTSQRRSTGRCTSQGTSVTVCDGKRRPPATSRLTIMTGVGSSSGNTFGATESGRGLRPYTGGSRALPMSFLSSSISKPEARQLRHRGGDESFAFAMAPKTSLPPAGTPSVAGIVRADALRRRRPRRRTRLSSQQELQHFAVRPQRALRSATASVVRNAGDATVGRGSTAAGEAGKAITFVPPVACTTSSFVASPAVTETFPPTGEVHFHDPNDHTIGGWLKLTKRDMVLMRRKVPSLDKDGRLASVLSGKMDAGRGDHHKSVVALLSGPQLCMTAKECRKVVLKHPHMLTMASSGPAARLCWMEAYMGMTKEQLRKVVLKQPKSLSNSIEVSIMPVVAFLTEELGLSLPQVVTIILKFPEVMNLSVERTLSAKVAWFEKNVGMKRSDVARTMLNLPALFAYSIEDNIEPKIKWLQQALGASRPTVLEMLLKWPGILCCNVERNLEPTLSFFRNELQGEEDEIRAVVIQKPRILGASIERRMRPRMAAMRKLGVVATFSEHRWMVSVRTDAAFDKWVERF